MQNVVDFLDYDYDEKRKKVELKNYIFFYSHIRIYQFDIALEINFDLHQRNNYCFVFINLATSCQHIQIITKPHGWVHY